MSANIESPSCRYFGTNVNKMPCSCGDHYLPSFLDDHSDGFVRGTAHCGVG